MGDWILLVDDDSGIQESFSFVLNALGGFQVKVANNGRQALQLIEHEAYPPTVIFLDVWMPVMGGVEFCRMRESNPKLSRIPIVLFSADNRINSLAGQLNVQGVLTKPVDIDVLLSTARRFMTSSSAPYIRGMPPPTGATL